MNDAQSNTHVEGMRTIPVDLVVSVELAEQIVEDDTTAQHFLAGIRRYLERRLNGETAPITFEDAT